MPRIVSRVDVHSSEFRDNAAAMRALVAELNAEVARVARGGSRAATEKHRAAGKLTARERIRVLLDTGSPFLEFSQLAAHGLYGGDIACAGIITGIGRVSGRECVIVANDPTVKGGTYYPLTVKKHLRAQEIAAREPPAVRVPGGERRRLSAGAGRGVSGPRELRAHLLQPGDALGGGRGADLRRARLVHGRRRLCSGHVG